MDYADFLQPGLTGQKEEMVTEGNTALSLGSGGLAVYATPAMIALMEAAALSAVDPLLPSGYSTVGTDIKVRHISATPGGMKVSAVAELLGMDGRVLSFSVSAFDDAGKIGEGTHSRFIIENEKFMAKTEGKKNR